MNPREEERRLLEAEEQVHLVRSVVERGFSAVLIANAESPDPRILYINPAFARATGYSPEKIIGQPLSTVTSLTTIQERLRNIRAGDERLFEETSPYRTAEGERWGEWRVGPVKDKSGKLTHWLIIFRDITERKQLEKEILEITDRERQRIGQDLHDGLCQQLAGIELMSQALEQQLAARSKKAAARVGEIASHVREAISQTRLLARGLSPVSLQYDGLVSALKELAAHSEHLFGIACRFQHGPSIGIGDAAVATHCYRIAQEAVSNAVKHGKAKQVRISLERAADRVILRVVDNGSGFPRTMPQEKGMGLRIMQYRAGMMGGSLSIEPNSEGGTSVVCSFPAQPA